MQKLSSKTANSLAAMALVLIVTGGLLGTSLPAYGGDKPIDWDKKLVKARQLMDTNNVEEAMKIYDEQLKKHPEVAPLHCDFGKCLKKRGKLSLARSEFKRATEVDPNYAESWYELGAMYESDKDYQLAVNSFERYLSLAPYSERKDAVKDRLNFCKQKL